MAAFTTKPGNQYDAWRSLIESRCGVFFSEARSHQLSSALQRRMRAARIADPDEYYRLVSSPQRDTTEWSALLEAVTNHDTCFYRHAPTFDTLSRDLLPALARGVAARRSIPVSIWSAGCSTGEEAYTAAMVGLEAARRHTQLAPSVLGSDVSAASLQTAHAAIYSTRSAARLPEWLHHHLDKQGPSYRVTADARAITSFGIANLIDPSTYPSCRFDFILCQNVFVYFRSDARASVLRNLSASLKPGGYLLPGPGEIAGVPCDSLRCVNLGGMQAFLKQPAAEAPAGA